MSDHYQYNNTNSPNDEDSEEFSKAVRLHRDFQKDIQYSEDFLKKRYKKDKNQRFFKYIIIILICLSAGAGIMYYILSKSDEELSTFKINIKEEIVNTYPVDSELDLIIAEHFTREETEQIVQALKDNFGNNFKSNLFLNGSQNTVFPSDTLTSELINSFSLNTNLSAEEQSRLLKLIIASTNKSEVPLKLLIINNLAEASEYTQRTGELFLDLDDLQKINERYSEIIFLQNKEVNKTTQLLFSTSKVTIPKKIIRY